ncbi:MAG: hypothetical protein ACE5PV_15665 [Candidatus Poribacteria bacterium]
MELKSELERKKVEVFFSAHFATGVIPPFSFIYGGKSSSEFLKDWQFSKETKSLDGKKTEHLFTYTDLQTSLEARCVCTVFSDFPAVEWLLTFENCGKDDTPIIEDVQALDIELTRKPEGEFVLHRALGSSASRMDFAPIDEVMHPNANLQLAPIGGRSSNTNVLPFFNIEAPGEGVMVGIGWSGQWATELIRDDGTSLKVRAGMELTHLKLHPGEKIRTPRILLLFWGGDDSPLASSGGPACAAPLPGFEEFNRATEHNQIALAERYRQFGLETEYWWIDAGWFEGYWPNGVGNWFPREDGFPNGLKPVSDAVKKMGMGFLLWF